MDFVKARKALASLTGRADTAALGRREVLAGIGLASLVGVAAKLALPTVSQAKTLAPPAAEPQPAEVSAKDAERAEGDTSTEVTELSSRRRRWRRWRRRHYWRRRYWRHRYWRRPWHWRRRRWWRRRRYWY
jgi:hypothetical protein